MSIGQISNILGLENLVEYLVSTGGVTFENKGDTRLSVGDKIKINDGPSVTITPFDLTNKTLADKKMERLATQALGMPMRVVRGPTDEVDSMVGLNAQNDLVIIRFSGGKVSHTVTNPVRMTEYIFGDNVDDKSGNFYAKRQINEAPTGGKFLLPKSVADYIFSEKYGLPWSRIENAINNKKPILSWDVATVLWAAECMDIFRSGGRVEGLNMPPLEW